MKFCVTSKGDTTDSVMDPRFGRAAYFVIIDTDEEIIKNSAAVSGGGAGVTSGQLMVDKDVKAVVTGNMGPNAMDVLKAANIKIFKGEPVAVKENIKKFKDGDLKEIDNTVPSHYGMNVND